MTDTLKKDLPAPRGVTVEQAAAMLKYSRASIRRLIAAGIIVAWKPAGRRGRKWLIDEVSLARLQAAQIGAARKAAAPVQSSMLADLQP